jgi:selenocysteine-specific elongation factor
MTSAEVAAALGLPRAGVADDLNRGPFERFKVGGDTYFVSVEGLERLVSGTVAELVRYHEEHPKSTGIAAGALRDRVDRRVVPKVFDAVLESAAARGLVRIVGGDVRHPQAAASALAEEDEALAALLPLLEGQGLAPGTVVELATATGVDIGVARKALTKLVAAGRVVRLGPDLHFSADAVEDARTRIVEFLEAKGTMLASEARDILGTSRKYVVPLLEYFDSHGVTKREGDARTLRRG